MSAFDVISLVVLVGLVWLWLDSFKAREAGIKAARSACDSEDLQLLDDTVAIASLKPARNNDGQVTLRRVYQFEFSDTGNNRRNGSVVLLGCRVVVVNIGLWRAPEDIILH
ncbi:MAG: DUF3301 domain-containing protein [Georgfuchsia sp.]